MLVLKFGGSCLLDVAAFRRAAAILCARLRHDDAVVAVVSAMAGTTDSLLSGGYAAEVARHRDLVIELGGDPDALPMVAEEDPDGVEVPALGECLAVALLATACREIGVAATTVDPGEIGLRCSEDPHRARPLADWRRTMTEALTGRRGLLLVPGFFGRDLAGRKRLLGRNSGDLSAALIAVAAGAPQLEVLARVAGLMTADPDLVPAARHLPRVSHDEMTEIAAAGAPVLHPEALRCVREAGLPVLLRGLAEGGPVTEVLADRESGAPFKALVHQARIRLVRLESLPGDDMTEAGFRALETLRAAGISPLAMTSSASSIALALPEEARLLVESLAAFAVVRRHDEAAALELVGRAFHSLTDASARVLGCLARAGISAAMIAESVDRPVIHLVLPRPDLRAAAQLLHAEFC